MAISLVQTPTAATGAGATVTKTYASATTNGNLLIIGIIVGATTAPGTTVTDNKGNTWNKVFSLGSGAGWTEFWYAYNIVGGATHTVTINNPGFLGVNAITREYSGLTTTDPKDVFATATGTTAAMSSGATAATAQASELVVGVFGDDWGAALTYTAGTGFGNRVSSTSGAAGDINLEDMTVAATGAQTATLTASQPPSWVAGVITFKGASGGSTFIAQPNLMFRQAVNRASTY